MPRGRDFKAIRTIRGSHAGKKNKAYFIHCYKCPYLLHWSTHTILCKKNMHRIHPKGCQTIPCTPAPEDRTFYLQKWLAESDSVDQPYELQRQWCDVVGVI